ncbi:serine hydrolase domain-containing protein [Nocardia bovistercoris]|uniref:Beta-lactamase family protein n=1 Tax=Nocardia bovistercoris TaxID=2785916 RepID=A0A931IBV6_9NOCA|nr:serine hydrolase [Nocardia bovistercoris]MBH0776995.1 beta-lactamase family protein [Nocardia bovistercoris]
MSEFTLPSTIVSAGGNPPATAVPGVAASPAQILLAGARVAAGGGFPGVIGMVRNDPYREYVAVGFKKYQTQIAADSSAQFRIGGNTEAYTATVLLQLEAEGALSLDDTVQHWLPGAVAANGNDGAAITVRQLLNHTSGLPEYSASPTFTTSYTLNFEPYQPWAPQDLVNIALTQPPLGVPGQKFAFANTNYVLAGMVIEAVTGNTAAAEIRTRILTPFALDDTSFPTDDPQLYGNYLEGHSITWGIYRFVTASQVQAFGAAGAIVSTLDDLSVFTSALISGQLLPATQQEALKTTVPVPNSNGKASYGLGVLRTETAAGPVWQHTGGVLGYYSLWLTSDDGAKQVVVAANEHHMATGTTPQLKLGQAGLDAYAAL